MYENYFGLKEKPFSVLPDPDFLYLSTQHGSALSALQYGVRNESELIVVTGEIGCGKTILLRQLLNDHEQDATIGLISNTSKFQDQILERVLLAFGLEFEGANCNAHYSRLVDFLVHEYARRRRVMLIIDEAQNLSKDAFEELRTLLNLNSDKDELIQLILCGQPELVDTLRKPRMKRLAQRIAVHYHLTPLTASNARQYVHHRLQVAGGRPALFTDEACSIIYRMSRGIPRLINRHCDTALLYAYGESRTQIDEALAAKVAQDIYSGGLSGISEVPTRAAGSPQAGKGPVPAPSASDNEARVRKGSAKVCAASAASSQRGAGRKAGVGLADRDAGRRGRSSVAIGTDQARFKVQRGKPRLGSGRLSAKG